MKPEILFLLIIIGVGLIQCELNNEDITKQIPPKDWINGVWRSDYNDSVKFINDTIVYFNSLRHYCRFDEDSIRLRFTCCPLETDKSYKYDFNIKNNQLILYNFSNVYGIISYDSVYSLHNPDSTLFIKSGEDMKLSLEEWIQGLWVDQDNNFFLFTRPYLIKKEDEYQWCTSFIKKGIFYITCPCVIDQYVFTQDSFRIHLCHFSSWNAFVSYPYEFKMDEDLLILYNFSLYSGNNLDTVIFYKQ